MLKLNSPAAEMTTFLRVHYLVPNSPHYSWPYSRGHCHGVYFFFTSLNWKSRENESRHPHMEWAIGLTLTRPQTAKWKNSFICHMDCWRLCWRSVWVLMSEGVVVEILWCFDVLFILAYFHFIYHPGFFPLLTKKIYCHTFNLTETIMPCALQQLSWLDIK